MAAAVHNTRGSDCSVHSNCEVLDASMASETSLGPSASVVAAHAQSYEHSRLQPWLKYEGPPPHVLATALPLEVLVSEGGFRCTNQGIELSFWVEVRLPIPQQCGSVVSATRGSMSSQPSPRPSPSANIEARLKTLFDGDLLDPVTPTCGIDGGALAANSVVAVRWLMTRSMAELDEFHEKLKKRFGSPPVSPFKQGTFFPPTKENRARKTLGLVTRFLNKCTQRWVRWPSGRRFSTVFRPLVAGESDTNYIMISMTAEFLEIAENFTTSNTTEDYRSILASGNVEFTRPLDDTSTARSASTVASPKKPTVEGESTTVSNDQQPTSLVQKKEAGDDDGDNVDGGLQAQSERNHESQNFEQQESQPRDSAATGDAPNRASLAVTDDTMASGVHDNDNESFREEEPTAPIEEEQAQHHQAKVAMASKLEAPPTEDAPKEAPAVRQSAPAQQKPVPAPHAKETTAPVVESAAHTPAVTPAPAPKPQVPDVSEPQPKATAAPSHVEERPAAPQEAQAAVKKDTAPTAAEPKEKQNVQPDQVVNQGKKEEPRQESKQEKAAPRQPACAAPEPKPTKAKEEEVQPTQVDAAPAPRNNASNAAPPASESPTAVNADNNDATGEPSPATPMEPSPTSAKSTGDAAPQALQGSQVASMSRESSIQLPPVPLVREASEVSSVAPSSSTRLRPLSPTPVQGTRGSGHTRQKSSPRSRLSLSAQSSLTVSPGPVRREADTDATAQTRIEVTGYRVVGDHVEYQVLVVLAGRQWVVMKRYNDFAALHKALLKQFPTMATGGSPSGARGGRGSELGAPKDVWTPFWKKKNKDTCERRKAFFQQYMKLLVCQIDLWDAAKKCRVDIVAVRGNTTTVLEYNSVLADFFNVPQQFAASA